MFVKIPPWWNWIVMVFFSL